MPEYALLGLVSIVALGILAQWIAWRMKLPAILLLLIFGIVAGPLTGVLQPDMLFGELLVPFVSLSVAVILFEGGLSLRLSELKEIGNALFKLITVGVIITWVLSAVFAWWLLDMGLQLSLLFGAILIVTGPTVIIPLLRQVRPAGVSGSLLKWEGIVNDPIGAMMSVLVFELLLAGGLANGSTQALVSIVNTVVFGTFFGLLGAAFIYIMLKRHLIPDFLQNPVSLMTVVVIFAASNLMQHESGLWAVTVMGIGLANQKSVRVKHIIEFKENLRVLLISALFILLASRLQMSHFEHFDWTTVAFLGLLIFLVRPASIFLSTIGSRLKLREKLFLSWMAPRGIVAAAISSIFALELAEAGFANAEMLVPNVFIVIIGTVTIYGLTASWVACRLKVAKPIPRGVLILGAHEWARKIGTSLQKHGIKVLMADSNWDNIAQARRDGLETYYGNILSEYALDEIDLDGIGHLLAITPNDEVNSLSVLRFSDVFGSSEVFQLAPLEQSRRKEREVPDYLSGRILFSKDLNYTNLSRMLEDGAYLETTQLTENKNLRDFRKSIKERVIPLFLVTENEQVRVYSVDNPPTPNEGDYLISLILPSKANNQTEAAQTQTEAEAT